MFKKKTQSIVAVMMIILSACSGGSSGTNEGIYNPTPAPTPAALYTEDFEGYALDAENISPWKAYISRFQNDCSTYIDGYQVSPTVNGDDISAIATGEAGPEQGEKYINVFSNYSEDQNSLCLETNVYREYIINDDFDGDFSFTFDSKRPSENGVTSPSSACLLYTSPSPRD